MASIAPSLTLSVTEQPAKLHRFRYLKEIKDGRMGSVLHGRSSQKTPVKVTVAAGETLSADCRLKLIGCTVFDDLTPHPFYLMGDDCMNEVFQKEFSISAASRQCEISLDRIAIVCTPKKAKTGKAKKKDAANGDAAQDDAYQQRLSQWNFFNKAARANPFQSKDVNKLKLAFQVFIQLPDSEKWVAASCAPVVTDLISDAKIYSEMTVDYVIPKTVSRQDQDVWLYMKDPLPAESAARFKVILEGKKLADSSRELPVKSVKKHLVVFNFSSWASFTGLGTFSVHAQVVDKETGDYSEPVALQLDIPAEGWTGPGAKKTRRERTLSGEDILDELLVFATEQDLPDTDFLQQSDSLLRHGSFAMALAAAPLPVAPM